ncbi:MAG: hypothetical protein AAGA72_18725 [Pseudomonadota bacterium]
MDFTPYIKYAEEVFAGEASPLFFNPDFAREFVVAIMIFLIGWAMSLRTSKKRIKNRIVDELIMAQRELFHRAYPKDWKKDGVRHEWMLTPFLDRINFLIFSLKEDKQISEQEIGLIERYADDVDKFIAYWATVKHRTMAYDDKYESTYVSLKEFLERAANKHVPRIAPLYAKAATIAPADDGKIWPGERVAAPAE